MPGERTIAESARQRAFRVPLDHFRQSDPLIRIKWWLSLAVLVLTTGYVAWLFIDQRSGGRNASPNKLASAHATWNDDCRRCHVDFRPLSADAVDLFAVARGGSSTDHRQLVDRACATCHAAQAAPHHTNLNAGEIAACAACHQEHRGTSADIKRPADAHCTNCHSDIAAHRSGASILAQPINNVARFAATTHPDFRSLASDPGNITFNHWLHLQPGLAVSDARQKLKLTDLDSTGQSQYQRFIKGELIQLDCSACHQPEAVGGESMQPIAYELHCRACHPIEVNLTPDARPASVPHGLSAQRLTEALDGMLLAERLKTAPAPATPDESGAAPLVPGRTLGQNLAQKIGDDVARRRTLAMSQVRLRCVHCHHASDEGEVLPATIPAVWLSHARFDHSAHQHVDCRTCHAAAYAGDKQQLPDDKQVMIAGLATCVQCHAPPARGTGGARFDCAECHRYHSFPESALGSFPGSSLGTQLPEAPASSAGPLVRPVSLVTQAVVGSANHSHPDITRLASCAAAGCHGDARPGAPAWRSALSTWLARDPHAQAYEVLWTFRAREMTRQLAPRDAGGEAPAALDDEAHQRALQKRCLNCHATAATDRSGAATLGVHCNSCHGPSDAWLATHYRQRFRRDTPGFADTKNLAARAAVCLPCHVGPINSSGGEQVVDHDLIAAGHPRLNFEFQAYFESLPAHWDRRADEFRNSPAPHFQSWRVGQQEQAQQQARLAQHYQQSGRASPGEFAQFDCSLCHHPVEADRWATGWPRKSIWPRGELQQTQPLAMVRALQTEAGDPGRSVSFDEALQTYLATKAVLADLPGPATESARAALDELGRFLGKDCYGVAGGRPPPSQYDFPVAISRKTLAQRLAAVKQALDSLPATNP